MDGPDRCEMVPVPVPVPAEVVALAGPPCAPRSIAEALPRHPQPSAHAIRREAALRAALDAGAIPLRDPHKLAMLKPLPLNYTADTSHLGSCTWCENAKAARAAVRAHAPRAVSGAPHLFIDEAELASWAGVVLEQERPAKARARFKASSSSLKSSRLPLYRDHPMLRSGFGMPGTVLYEGGRFRAWLGQGSTRYCESYDGIHFDEPGGKERGLQWLAQPPRGLRKQYWGELTDEMAKSREIGHETFTVYREDDVAAAEVTADVAGAALRRRRARQAMTRYKAAFTCDLLGHAPYPDFWFYKRGDPPPLDVWLAAPLFNGERAYTWESTCLAHSADGFNWTMYDNRHQLGDGSPPLRMASDTANVVYRLHPEARGGGRGGHVAINRWAAAIPEGTHGTPSPNPNWWREVRGARLSTTRRLDGAEGPRGFTEATRWIFDKEGKDEHLRRQIYSLQVCSAPRLPLPMLSMPTAFPIPSPHR